MTARLQDLQRSFARHLRAEGSADRTVAIYGQAIRFFGEWLEAQGREAVVSELNRAAIREWLAQLADTKEPGTVKLRHRGLFRFCGWLVDEDELPEHPMKTLSPPQPKAKPVPVLTDDELGALMKACGGNEFRDRRVMITHHPRALLQNAALKKEAWEDLKLVMREFTNEVH